MEKEWTDQNKLPKDIKSFYTCSALITPWGVAKLEWKGWKEYQDDFMLTLNDEYIDCLYYDTLEDAQKQAEKMLLEKANKMIEFLTKKQK